MNRASELWSSRAGHYVRAGLVLAAALVSTWKYGGFLGKYYDLGDWLAWRLLLLWANCAIFSTACLSAGHLALRRVFRAQEAPLLETLVLSMALGVVLFVLGMYGGGFLHLYGPTFAYALPAVMIAAGARDVVDRGRTEVDAWRAATPPRSSPLDRLVGTVAAMGGVACVVLAYLEVMTPDAINFDSSWVHMTVGESYARHGRIVPFPGDWVRNVPHLASLLYSWAFQVPWQITATKYMGALHLEFCIFLWTLAGVAALARWLTDGAAGRGAWASFFLFPAIFVYDANMGGAADHVLAFFGPPAILVAVRVARSFDVRASALCGVLLGGALLTKYQASYLIAGTGLVIASGVLVAIAKGIKPRSLGGEPSPVRWGGIARSAAAIAGGIALTSSPHFLKNWAFYRNPFYPFMQDKIASVPGYPGAALAFEYIFKDYNWRPHGTSLEIIGSSLSSFFTYSFEPHYSFTHNVPNVGSLFTLSLAFWPFVGGRRRLAIGLLACVGSLMAWALTFRVDRNLQILMPLLAATTCAILVRAWQLGPLARIGLVPLVTLQICWGADTAFYSGKDRLESAVDLIRAGFDGRRDDRFEYRRDFREVNKVLPASALSVLHNSQPSLGIERDILLDMPGFQGAVIYDGLGGPRALYDYWRHLGVTHLLDDTRERHPCGNKQDEILWAEFMRYATPVSAGRFRVTTLEVRPPADPPAYTVLSVGMYGYADGLYPIGAMNVEEQMPEHVRAYPSPSRPFPEPEQLEAVVTSVDAVVTYGQPPHYRALNEILARDFTAAVSYSIGYIVYIRKTPRR